MITIFASLAFVIAGILIHTAIQDARATTLQRRSWYLAGRMDERQHAKTRTTFPALPD